MEDTIVLVLNETQFKITNHDLFTPSTIGLFGTGQKYYKFGARSNIVCKQNPTTTDIKKGKYKPRLSVTRRLVSNRGFEIMLKIEFSIPKLYFGNNFDELTDELFYEIVSILKSRLEEMGVVVDYYDLVKAPVSSVHFSKNIVLTDYTTPHLYLEKISKLDINKRLDINQTDYRNEGHSFKIRSNTFEICFYDKIKDIEQSQISIKRSIDKDPVLSNKRFKRAVFIKPFELLRMEVRIIRKQKIKSILKKIDHEREIDFNNIFNSKLSRSVLLFYIDQLLVSSFEELDFTNKSVDKLFVELMLANPDKKVASLLKILGYKVVIDKVGVRAFRELINRYSPNVWYSINREVRSIKNTNVNPDLYRLRNAIDNFCPVYITDYLRE